MSTAEGWAAYAAEQERHAETAARLEAMTREARLSREATEKAVASRVARHELDRALRAADAPEDSMATEDDLLRYEGRAEAVEIMRDMLVFDLDPDGPWCREESCRHRHWRSGSMPTHRRGNDCPASTDA